MTLHAPDNDLLTCPQCDCSAFTLVDGEIEEGKLIAIVSVARSGAVVMWSGMLRCMECGHERRPWEPPQRRHLHAVP